MSLEHLKELKLPYYFYNCGNDTTIASMQIYVECQDLSLKDALTRHLYVEHTIIDDRVVKAMRNKADCYKKFYFKNAWTFGVVMGSSEKFKRRNRAFIFGARNFEKPFLQEKECSKMKHTEFGNNYLSKMFEISNVDEKKYNQSVRNLIKAVS